MSRSLRTLTSKWSATVRGLWSQWPGLEMQEGVLKRCWCEPATGEPRWQVGVPKDLRGRSRSLWGHEDLKEAEADILLGPEPEIC